ncbi:MAG: NusG domain II-containing protein [Deferribacteraceae bacterium]|jgi:hypothetical protein|nr:NusG domain II-containing protein [Deferribacteraceae bacterium]
MGKNIRIFDIAVALSVVALAIFFIADDGDSTTKKLQLIQDNTATTLRWQTQTISLEQGMVVEVEEDRARVISSDCPDKICVASGWVSECGQTAACLPNRVAITVNCE